MAIDSTVTRSRRAILTAALGAGGATVAAAVARPPAVRATNDDFIQVGHTYTATTVTELDATGSQAFGATSDTDDALYGGSGSGIGVHGTSNTGTGMRAYSTSGTALVADNIAGGQPAIFARSLGNSSAVFGQSGSGTPGTPAKTGVFGYAAQDATANGVLGQSPAGRAVYGSTATGYGVFGAAASGIASRGYSATGTAIYASTSGPKIGVALRAIGRVRLDNCAGIATIAAGHNSVVVTPGSDLLATSAVVATLMGSAGGATTVLRVSVNATADTFTIYLTANSTAAVRVAWHVFG